MPNELLAFLGFYVAGLALNLTPCVYPMLSVTVALFGVEAQQNRVLRASVYVLGMATMYSVLGASASLTGGFFGAWLASKWVLAGIGILMLILALGMFGLYQFQLPSGVLTRLSSHPRTGIIGMYLAGLIVGIFAAPCIGPPIVALLALVAAKGSILYGFSAFFILSLGLGTPYWLLGVSSGALRKLPRSGMWLVWMEHLFGVILLGAAAYFLVLAFGPKFLVWVIPAVLIAGGIYLGFIERAGNDKSTFRMSKWIFGFACVGAGLWFAIAIPKTSGIVWEPYDAAKLEAYQKSGSPIVLDFYADWCIPCHEMDNQTFSKKEVQEALQPFKKLRVDVTNMSSEGTRETTDKFHVMGVPTMIFFDTKGEEVKDVRIVGFVPPVRFLEAVKQVLKEKRGQAT